MFNEEGLQDLDPIEGTIDTWELKNLFLRLHRIVQFQNETIQNLRKKYEGDYELCD